MTQLCRSILHATLLGKQQQDTSIYPKRILKRKQEDKGVLKKKLTFPRKKVRKRSVIEKKREKIDILLLPTRI